MVYNVRLFTTRYTNRRHAIFNDTNNIVREVSLLLKIIHSLSHGSAKGTHIVVKCFPCVPPSAFSFSGPTNSSRLNTIVIGLWVMGSAKISGPTTKQKWTKVLLHFNTLLNGVKYAVRRGDNFTLICLRHNSPGLVAVCLATWCFRYQSNYGAKTVF